MKLKIVANHSNAYGCIIDRALAQTLVVLDDNAVAKS
jgi:hypothetical protein